MELLSYVADHVLSPVFNFVTRQMMYPFTAGGYVKELGSTTERLLAKKNDIMEKIEQAKRNGQRPTHQLQGWLDEVDAIKTQADAIVEKYNQRYLCFKCFSPNCYSNYSLSKNAEEKLLQVNRLLNDERTPAVQEVAITPVPPAVQEVPVDSTSYVDPNLGRVLGYIREDEKVGRIGVWGMGGVGKTRFLKQINNSFVGDSSFDHVIWITVSQYCPIAKVQEQIIDSLKLQKAEDDNSRSKIIFNFLKKRSFLLLLDDLWKIIDLEEVGIPVPLGVVDGCKRKAVLTTRSSDVCGQMEVRKSIKLECLKYGDAFNLFLEKVGEETINYHPSIRSLAANIVKELAGLPLALITIGRAMYQKKEPKEWENAIEQVKKSQLHELESSHENQSEGLFHRLKISYDSLKSDTLRDCFLSCSMWPAYKFIDKEELIHCWMGLGLIEDFDSMPEAYNCGYSLIGTLMKACLLEGDDEDDSRVSVHDLLHDMALWIACDNGKSKNKRVVVEDEVARDKKIWHAAEWISIMNREMKKLPPVSDYPSKLTTLMLQTNYSLKQLGDLRAFVALTYLDLSHCGFHNFPIEVCVLVQLQYLNLAYNHVTSLPEELGSLVNLKFMILRDNDVHIIPQGVIAKLKYLQVLDLFKVFDSDGETLTYLPSPLLEELESLNDLKGLGICVQGTSQLRRLIEMDNMPIWCLAINMLNDSTLSLSASFLTDEKIRKNLSILSIMHSNANQMVIESDHQHPTCHLPKLEQLLFYDMQCLKEIIWDGVVPKQLFQDLRMIALASCQKLKDISWILHLPHLQMLAVCYCSSMNQLIASESDDDSTPPFPSLKVIFLDTLPELVSICHSAFAFPALRSIDVRTCPKLKKLPFQVENIPSKLKTIYGEKEWFDGLEWEDSGVKTRLQNFLKEIDENGKQA